MPRNILCSVGLFVLLSLVGPFACERERSVPEDGVWRDDDQDQEEQDARDDDSVTALIDDYVAARENGDETVACIRVVQILEALDGFKNKRQYEKWLLIQEEACAHLEERDSDHPHRD